ncbi:hypothetical protein FNT36_10075 [Hymenobacter setariae]|uniref:Lipoprotein n=1 Tax=Hymenobacter setariae TaxID=2594794 RepID=A0A558BZ47_9BACT|nr:hypothetical protein [Hymenobacter setariae]TVT41762.1 hypothetical protein FNT36_10075 [Hymenobacter setariae]
MNFSFRPALALLLGASAALLTACDYKYSPGVNTQFEHGFNGTPTFTNADVNRDSVNYVQNVRTPIGKGSASDLKTASPEEQQQSAPAGKSSASPQSANGQLGTTDQAKPTSNATAPDGNQ